LDEGSFFIKIDETPTRASFCFRTSSEDCDALHYDPSSGHMTVPVTSGTVLRDLSPCMLKLSQRRLYFDPGTEGGVSKHLLHKEKVMSITSQVSIVAQFETSINQGFVGQFRRAKFQGFIEKVWATLIGQPNNLVDVKTITRGKSIHSCRYARSQTVRIQQIKGSEGRCQDFDRNFNPLKSHNQNRWVSIAGAWLNGTHLPAVDLIKIGDIYVVRDGHHRISVAKFMGCNFVDAHVTEWVLAD
jgi:hypothetical protein